MLLVEDDTRLADFTAEYLTRHDLFVEIARDGESGLRQALRAPFDVVVLDLMLPSRDGMSVCRELRDRSDVPIVMLTARTEEADRVMGLELGADDYVVKPFSARELLARIRAVVRRHRGESGPPTHSLASGRLRIDSESHRALLDGRDLLLTTFELRLLRVMLERRGRVLSREALLDLVTGTAEDSFDRSIDAHICRLRQKLGDDSRHPRLLKTVRGAGYLLAREDSE